MQSENDPSAGLSSDGSASSAVDFHEPSGTYRTAFDGHTRPVLEAILSAVAAATGNELLELPPLYWTIDADAVDALLGPPADHASEQCLTITFEYADCRVTAKADRTVVVAPDCAD